MQSSVVKLINVCRKEIIRCFFTLSTAKQKGCFKNTNHCHIEQSRNMTMTGKQICTHFDKLNVTNLFVF